MKISILIPVFNEKKTILDVLELVKNVDIEKEIIVVDDCSSDGTRELLKSAFPGGSGDTRVFYHEKNMGKGSAIRTAVSHAAGEYVIVQDADMEYSPQEIEKLVAEAESSGAGAVFGSRFKDTWRSTSLAHYLVNGFLTWFTNVLFNASLTDMETCYKMVRTDIIKGLGLTAERFEFEPEVTAKLLMKGVKIREVPISYRGRGYDEGKKITWKDGLEAVSTLIKMRFSR
jgi:glycosyltransferase involved in cell wall biosynthesis